MQGRYTCEHSWVLDWNEPAQGFYRSLGARPEDEWTVWRVEGPALQAMADGQPQPGSGHP